MTDTEYLDAKALTLVRAAERLLREAPFLNGEEKAAQREILTSLVALEQVLAEMVNDG